jgi:hypothetical protein
MIPYDPACAPSGLGQAKAKKAKKPIKVKAKKLKNERTLGEPKKVAHSPHPRRAAPHLA